MFSLFQQVQKCFIYDVISEASFKVINNLCKAGILTARWYSIIHPTFFSFLHLSGFSFRLNGRLQKHYESKHFQAKVTCGASGYSCGRSTRTEGSPTRGSRSPRSSNTLRRATGWRPLRVAPLEFMTSWKRYLIVFYLKNEPGSTNSAQLTSSLR